HQQIEAVHCHPTGCVRLFNVSAIGQLSPAIKGTDVGQSEEATLRDVVGFKVFTIYPPGEIDEQLVRHTLQDGEVVHSCNAALTIGTLHARRRWKRLRHIAVEPVSYVLVVELL